MSDAVEMHAIEQAVGALIIRASWLEEQLGRVLHYLRDGDEFAVEVMIWRMGWETLTKKIITAAENHPDGTRYLDLLEAYDVKRLGWIRHNTVHGRYSFAGGTRVDLRRVDMRDVKAFTVMGDTDQVLEAATKMHACAVAIEDGLPFGFGFPSAGRYLRLARRAPEGDALPPERA